MSVQISNPCHENWNKMESRNGGRHCSSCQKVVKDFTRMNDEELIAYLRTAGKNECGRFREDQVHAAGHSFFYNVRMKAAAFAGLLLARMFAPSTAAAQDAPAPAPLDGDGNAIHKNIYGDSVIFHVRGMVNDKRSGSGLSYSRILVKVNGKPAGGSAYTDADGKFELNIAAASSSDVITLTFSRRRYKDHIIQDYVPDGQELRVGLKMSRKARHNRHKHVMGAYSSF